MYALRYWWAVTKRSFTEARTFSGWKPPARWPISLVIVATAAFAMYWRYGNWDAVFVKMEWPLAVIAGAFSVFFLMMLSGLVLAPPKLQKDMETAHAAQVVELRSKIDTQDRLLIDDEKKTQIHVLLGELLRQANELLDPTSRSVTSDNGVTWAKRCKDWVAETASKLESEVSPTARSQFQAIHVDKTLKHAIPQWLDRLTQYRDNLNGLIADHPAP